MKKKTKIILISLVTFILVIAGLLTPYLIELVTYQKIVDEKTVAACDNYLEKYPDGRYVQDALFLKVTMADNKNPQAAIKIYLEKYPNGEFAELFIDFQKYLKENPNGTYESFKTFIRSNDTEAINDKTE